MASIRPENETIKEALMNARDFLRLANNAQAAKRTFAADRYAGAADAMVRVSEHMTRILQHNPPPRTPGRPEVARHLEHVYFRLQQANYFLAQSHRASAQKLPALARSFYESAARALDSGECFIADEFAKSADDIVAALESLAQAAAPVPPPPPPPHRP